MGKLEVIFTTADFLPDGQPDSPLTRNAAGGLEMVKENFGRLITSPHTDSLEKALEAAAENRSSDNLSAVAVELFSILHTYQMHFIGGDEQLWLDSVRKMQEIAEEAASMPDASGPACNLAGCLKGREWGFHMMLRSENTIFSLPQSQPIEADLAQALKWFQKGAALGDECSANNLARTERTLETEPKIRETGSRNASPSPAQKAA